jgi:hypothetical protein
VRTSWSRARPCGSPRAAARRDGQGGVLRRRRDPTPTGERRLALAHGAKASRRGAGLRLGKGRTGREAWGCRGAGRRRLYLSWRGVEAGHEPQGQGRGQRDEEDLGQPGNFRLQSNQISCGLRLRRPPCSDVEARFGSLCHGHGPGPARSGAGKGRARVLLFLNINTRGIQIKLVRLNERSFSFKSSAGRQYIPKHSALEVRIQLRVPSERPGAHEPSGLRRAVRLWVRLIQL